MSTSDYIFVSQSRSKVARIAHDAPDLLSRINDMEFYEQNREAIQKAWKQKYNQR